MFNTNNIHKYLLGAFAGFLIVAGCGGGGSNSGVTNSANGASIAGVTSQLLCVGDVGYMLGYLQGLPSGSIKCLSNTNSTPQYFTDFHQIAKLGWILVEVATPAGSSSISVSGGNIFLFQK